MQQPYYESYPPVYAAPSAMTNQEVPAAKEEDTQEIASFLLSLKHRSVTPEPQVEVDSEPAPTMQPVQPVQESYGYPSFAYEEPKPKPVSAVKEPQPIVVNPVELPPMTAALNLDYEALVAQSNLVYSKDRDLVPDALFVAMAQMRLCELTQADRVGCYKSRELGFVGMCCKHCGGQPGFGRYYPNSVRSLAQTTTSQTILKHIGSKCRFCPPAIRDSVLELQRQQAAREGLASGRPRYGSRKIFFQRVWARLHGRRYSAADEAADDASNQTSSEADEVASILSSSTPDAVEEEEEAASQSKRKNRFGALPTQKNKRMKVAAQGVPQHLFTAE